MRVHYLQHVPFENLASMEDWFRVRGHQLSCTRLDRNEELPALDQFDWLVVMGGPMGVADEERYPWLAREKEFIKAVLASDKLVLGICLGGQLIASALGAQVRRNPQREIGWFDICLTQQAQNCAVGAVLPQRMSVFHWHGDSFDLPPGAVHLAASEACSQQAFSWQERVLALQFHLETTPASAQALIDNSRDELDGSRFVQSEAQMLAEPERFTQINGLMATLLERMERLAK